MSANVKYFRGHHECIGRASSRSATMVISFVLVLSGCASIWNASDLAVWVKDRAVEQGCQRETIVLDDWYGQTAEGNIWRGTCRDIEGNPQTFGINVDAVWTPSGSTE